MLDNKIPLIGNSEVYMWQDITWNFEYQKPLNVPVNNQVTDYDGGF
jgi:hypothetical protein